MRILFVVCLLFLTYLPAFVLAKGGITGITLAEAKQQHQLKIEINDVKIEELLDKLVLVPWENNYNQEEAEEMVSRIANIHPTILHDLAVKNVKVILFSGNLTDIPYFADLKGITPRGWSSHKTWDQVPGAGGKLIAAAKIGASEPGNEHGSINLELHEIAHSVERSIFNGLRNDEEFLAIWQEEAPKLFNDDAYFNNYAEEYFAEVFAMYYLSKETNRKVLEKAPKTYDYMEKLENKRKNYPINIVTSR